MGPVAPEEFKEVLEQAQRVLKGEIPAPDPTQFGTTIVDETGRPQERLRFTDHPLNRVAFWITHQRYRDDPERGFSVMHRFVGLIRLMGAPGLEKWVGVDRGIYLVHPAVIAAAATQPLNSLGLFDEEAFIEAVQRIAEEEFPDVEPLS